MEMLVRDLKMHHTWKICFKMGSRIIFNKEILTTTSIQLQTKKKGKIHLNIKIIIINIIFYKIPRMEIFANQMFLSVKLLLKTAFKIFKINKKISMKGKHSSTLQFSIKLPTIRIMIYKKYIH